MRSPDFLDVETFPTITYRSRRIEPLDAGRFRMIGDLTIRKVTQEAALDTTLEGRMPDPWGHERAGYSATTVIRRKDFGLQWNVALEGGGVLVGDKVLFAPQGHSEGRTALPASRLPPVMDGRGWRIRLLPWHTEA